ncbi:hypothetical protein [Maridesulfovibrio frigidus]|uniref:hypothetical protein n=1 Tax=Maridesulfovibrio frigidus TaxID=340956 RepID=UPI0012EBDF01|nr:hypothetical protein [Maridesulfovibrio frigidus]
MTDEKQKTKESPKIWKAKAWNKWHWLQYHAAIATNKYSSRTFLIALAITYISTFAFLPSFELLPNNFFSNNFQPLTSLFLSLGCALLGSSAIAFSFMMFAMQVNIERLPHGLFHKFSSDKKLLFYLTGSIGLAISIVSLSMIPDSSWAAFAVANSTIGTISIFVLFLCGYKRALSLIDPSNQLEILLKETQKSFQIWDKRCERARPFYHTDSDNELDLLAENSMDFSRRAYFENNPYWHNQAVEACKHSISFANKYASRGEYEISGKALNCIILVNSEYVKIKGTTFFSNNSFIPTGYSHDNFISHSLELIRQYTSTGLHNKDERHIEQALSCMHSLANIFLAIKYSSVRSNKSHANLALGYLERAIMNIVPLCMDDVIMNGLREIGDLSREYALQAQPNDLAQFAETICKISLTRMSSPDSFPVVQIASEQLSKLTLNALCNCKEGTSYLFSTISSQSYSLISVVFSTIPDAPLLSNHSSYLSSLYSPINTQGFMRLFLGLTAELSRQESTLVDSHEHCFLNIIEWLKSIQDSHVKIFNQAASSQLPICTDLVMWTTSIIKGLITLTKSPHCPEELVPRLHKHIVGLSRTFIYTEESRDIFSHLETNSVTSNIFSCCQYAWQEEIPELSEKLQEVLFNWTKKAGQFETGWGIAGRGILGICAFSLIVDNPIFFEKTKNQIESLAEIFPQNILESVIRDLAGEISSSDNYSYSDSEIKITLRNVDLQKKNILLNEVIEILR